MKKILIVLLLSMAITAAQGAVPSAVHHWALDGDATDSGTGGTLGVVDGVVSANVTFTYGAIGQAAVFNGVDTLIDLPAQLLPAGTTTITLSYWVRPDTYDAGSHYDSVISTDGWNVNSIHSILRPAGQIATCINCGGSGATQWQTLATIPLNEWTHHAWTFKLVGTTIECKYYLDGELDSTKTTTATVTGIEYQSAYIGALDWFGTPVRFLDGMVDDLQIWDVVLTEAEVLELYASGLKKAWNPDPTDGAEAVDPSGLTLSWSAPGAYPSAPTYNVYLGPVSTGPTLKSSGQSELTYTPSPELNYAAEYVWRIDVNDPNGMMTHTGDPWYFKTAGVRDPIPSDTNPNASTEPLLRWTGAPIVDQYEVWFGTPGSLVSLGTTTLEDSSELTVPALTPNTPYQWRVDASIGILGLTGPVWNFTTGQLIGEWKLDGNANDTSSFGNHGTITGATSVPTEKAYLFDGDSYIDIPAALYNPVETAVSVAFWTKGDLSLPTGENYIYSAVTSLDAMVGRCHLPYYGLIVYDSGNTTQSNPAYYNRIIDAADSESMYKNQWNHWLFTSDTESGDMKAYYNGELWRSASGQTHEIGADDVFDVLIGFNAAGTAPAGNGYHGMIKDVRVYDMEVGPNLAATIYAEGPYANNPDPADGDNYVLPTAILSWDAGAGAVSHDVYFGTDPCALPLVSDDQPGTTYDPTGDMTPGDTYHWRVDENDGSTTWISGAVWSFTVLPYEANRPTPEDDATGVDPLTVLLEWSAGWQADTHDVYFGTVGNLQLVSGGQAGTTYDPGELQYDTEYIWRIDEHEGATPHPGEEWSFRTIVPDCPTNPVGDINGDCIVDLVDFAELAANWLDCNLVPATACP